MKPPINTFEDLANSKDVGILIKEDVVIGLQILVKYKMISVFRRVSVFD
jgi:hypothetical protein